MKTPGSRRLRENGPTWGGGWADAVEEVTAGRAQRASVLKQLVENLRASTREGAAGDRWVARSLGERTRDRAGEGSIVPTCTKVNAHQGRA